MWRAIDGVSCDRVQRLDSIRCRVVVAIGDLSNGDWFGWFFFRSSFFGKVGYLIEEEQTARLT